MQYGIMKYNTLQRWADRAGWAGAGAGRAEAGGKVKLIRRGGARPLQPARPRHGGRTWHQPPAAGGHMTGGRGCARLLPGTPATFWARSQETSAPCPECGGCWREVVLVLVSVLSHDASAEQQWPPVSLYRRKLSPLFIIPTQQASCRHSDGACDRLAFEDSFLYMICRSAPYWGLIIIFIFII